MNKEQFEKRINQIPSLYTQRHAHIIYGLIRWLDPDACIEIGSYAGYMTCWMAKALQDNGRDGILHAVDNFSLGTSSGVLHNSLVAMGVSDNVYIHDTSSNQFQIPQGIQLAFIDGDHSLDGVIKDFCKCESVGAECIILHDTSSWWGPREFVDKFENEEDGFIWGKLEIGFDQGLTILMKNQKGTLEFSQEQFPKGYIEK